MNIRISPYPFDIKKEIDDLSKAQVGAVVTFTGMVRHRGEQGDLLAMELEHYPGMTESCIANIVQQACQRWALADVTVVHRVGRLLPGDDIVLVAVAAAHRAEAFAAAGFIMDYLKVNAPFWKKEITRESEYWIEQKAADRAVLSNWE